MAAKEQPCQSRNSDWQPRNSHDSQGTAMAAEEQPWEPRTRPGSLFQCLLVQKYLCDKNKTHLVQVNSYILKNFHISEIDVYRITMTS